MSMSGGGDKLGKWGRTAPKKTRRRIVAVEDDPRMGKTWAKS